ncbi:hypothetical protein Pint_14551 [Pistacia integerrima]|uniref:Uncharacterized protein n=1 Tax=Pistacia integerrima TaxID=434235 RepID=A0ACC0Y5Z4_9ROSI|nr:hypothetical protein Pint_14551 [Pistacia integerrima]
MELQKPSLRSLVEKLTHLKELALDEVNISSSIPHILANFSLLTILSLVKCELHGEFPTKVFQLPNLHYINVQDNENLFGYLPEFERTSLLQHLILNGTRFSGEIPYSIGNLRFLVMLNIRYCNLSGSIPSSLGNLSSLEELRLGYNNFSSQDSRSLSWIAKYSKLTILDLSCINLVGEIPSWLMNLNQLEILSLSSNRLTGRIPFEIRNPDALVFSCTSFKSIARPIS